MTENSAEEGDQDVDLPNPHVKEKNRGIIEAFSRSEYTVLTRKEIDEQLKIEERQVRRRLNDLHEEGVLGMRETSAGKLWWIEEDVKEPITVKYPLTRFVLDHLGLLYVVVGLAVGAIGILSLTLTAFLVRFGVGIPLISANQIFWISFLIALAGGVIILLGPIAELLERVLQWGIKRFTNR